MSKTQTSTDNTLEPVNLLHCENKKLRNEVMYLQEQLKWFRDQLFGKRSERLLDEKDKGVMYLPGFEDIDQPPSVEEVEQVVPAHTRKKPKRDGSHSLIIPEGLPVERTVYDLSEKEKVCPDSGERLVKIGEEVTRKLAHRPGSMFIKEIVRPKYAHPSKEEMGIFIEDPPSSILPKARADESLLAEIVTRKFADHLPLYRLSEIFSRDGIQITRQLLSQWVLKLGMVLLPLYLLMKKQILDSGNVFVDETSVRLQVKGKGKLQKAYMWILVGGEGADPPYQLYGFYPNRKHKNAEDLLRGFKGSMHSDKYGAYEELAKQDGIIWHPCWAHIRRKFVEAESGDPKFRDWILRKIRYLFMLERVAWSRSPEERLRIRKEKEEPIVDELIAAIQHRLVEGTLLPKSKFREALNYTYGLVPYLKNYLFHANARMDNNVAERAVRPLAVGRKNWLFVGSQDGGESTAVLLSLVQTCRSLKINPREYLEDVMRRFLDHPASRLEELLPDKWKASRQVEDA
jgi:transposase